MGVTSRIVVVLPWLYRSPLPLAREIAAFAALGGRAVVDLTRRERGVVARACARHHVVYIKHGLPYETDSGELEAAVRVVLAAPRPVLVHCFHGRDRTGLVIARVLELAATWD